MRKLDLQGCSLIIINPSIFYTKATLLYFVWKKLVLTCCKSSCMKLAGFADDDAAQFNNFYDKLNQKLPYQHVCLSLYEHY